MVRSLGAVLQAAAIDHGDRLFLRFIDKDIVTPVTFAETWEIASRWAALFVEFGVGPGEAVLTALPNTVDFVGSYFGALLCGAIPAPSAPLRAGQADEYSDILAERAAFLGGRVFVVPQDRGELARAPRWGGIRVLTAADLPATGIAPSWRAQEEDIAHLQFTSGTSGQSKATQLSHRALIEQARVIADRLSMDRDVDRGMSWLPLYHDMGLIGFLITPLTLAGEVTLLSTEEFIRRPTSWIKALSHYKTTVTGAPPSAYAITARRLKATDVADYDLSGLRIALCGAETVRSSALEMFVERLAPTGFRREALLPTYGLAENGLAVSMPMPLSGPQFDHVDAAGLADSRAIPSSQPDACQIASLGHAMAEVEIEIRRDDGTVCAERELGEIVVRSTSLASGYLQDPETTAATFRDGALWTGDIGYLAGDVLHMTGRKKELLIVGGRNYFPDDLESLVTRSVELRGGKVVALSYEDPERATEAIAIVLESGLQGAERDTLRLQTRTSLTQAGFPVTDVCIVAPRSIPTTLNGKVQRVETKRLYLTKGLHT